MTSRERVRNTLGRKPTDRVPIDLGGWNVTGMHAYEYVLLGKHLGIDLECPKITDPLMMLARIEEPLRRRFRVDTVPLENLTERWGLEHRNWKVWGQGAYPVLMPGGSAFRYAEDGTVTLLDPKGSTVASMPPEGLYFDPVSNTALSAEFVLADPDVCRNRIPLYSQEELTVLEKYGRYLNDFTDYAVMGGFRKGQLGHNWSFAGHSMTDWFCLLHLEPQYTREMLAMTAERAMENLKLYIEAVGDFVDVIFISSTDYGNQLNSTISPEIFQDRYLPCYRLMNDYVHSRTNAKTFYHSCGSIRVLLDFFIESGADIINPVQASAEGMGVQGLKDDFGDRVIFWGGGVDSQKTLQFGSSEDAEREVKERITILGKNGGYVFAADHNIQYGVPPENIEVMFDRAYEAGFNL